MPCEISRFDIEISYANSKEQENTVKQAFIQDLEKEQLVTKDEEDIALDLDDEQEEDIDLS